MRTWVWLLPALVWKYFFAHFPREQVRLDGRTRFLLRLDDEFVLIYDPQAVRRAEAVGMQRLLGLPEGSGVGPLRAPLHAAAGEERP